ncbi:MAG: hypothetical protein HOV81_44610 [Kofleriaceae bacterium]|nr:hypothetical protein [Kofleriaceae bacterium]
MKLLLVGAVLLTACGGTSPTETQKLVFERWSTPQATGHDVLLAARGNVVVMVDRLSADGGATWMPIDPAFGSELSRVAIVGTTVATFSGGLKRWDLVSGNVTTAGGAPSFTTDRTWRIDPQNGRFMTFDAIENAIAIETPAGGWVQSKLPQPSPTEVKPYVRDIESNGQVLLALSGWGTHRSLDGGVSWQLVSSSTANSGRDLLVLADSRFAQVGGTTSNIYDTQGNLVGPAPDLKIDANTGATVCEDGTLVSGNKLTTNLGATWSTLTPTSDLPTMTVQHADCGGAGQYWMLVISEAWGYRLVRFDAVGQPGVAAGNWEDGGDQMWTTSGPPITRLDDGTFLVAGLALAKDAETWTLQEIPARTWASGQTVFGVSKQKFFASSDGGSTWIAAAATGLGVAEPEAFAQSGNTLYVSQFTSATAMGVSMWRSVVWKSDDLGGTWSAAYDSTATRNDGEKIVGDAHRFVGITDKGDWISTDAVSRDGGTTWQKTTVLGDKGLAHLMLDGTLVTGGADESLWRVYDDGGLGDLVATYQIVVDDKPIPASQLRSVAFDEEGYAYVARGTPRVQLWRSSRPLR